METYTKVIDRDTSIARLVRDDDKWSILRLSALHYGDKEQAKEGFFDWLYGGTPAGRPIVAVAEALASGEIVGFTWHLPFQVSLQGVEALCLMGCNALVHPDFRLKGIYLTLREMTFERVEDQLFTYGFPKPAAIYPHGKAGMNRVTRIPLMVMPLDMHALAKSRISNSIVGLAMDVGWRVASRTILRPHRPSSGSYGIRISEHTTFDTSFDHFWEKVAGKYPIIIKRDRAFLNWRFCRLSFRSYQILSARAGSEMLGYAVLRCADISRVRTGLIMDLLVEESSRGEAAGLQLLAEAKGWFQRNGAALAGCLMLPHTQESTILQQAGFVNCPERFAPQTFALSAKSLSPHVTNEFLLESKNWFITSANHDAV